MPAVTAIDALKQIAPERPRKDLADDPQDGFAATLDRTLDETDVSRVKDAEPRAKSSNPDDARPENGSATPPVDAPLPTTPDRTSDEAVFIAAVLLPQPIQIPDVPASELASADPIIASSATTIVPVTTTPPALSVASEVLPNVVTQPVETNLSKVTEATSPMLGSTVLPASVNPFKQLPGEPAVTAADEIAHASTDVTAPVPTAPLAAIAQSVAANPQATASVVQAVIPPTIPVSAPQRSTASSHVVNSGDDLTDSVAPSAAAPDDGFLAAIASLAPASEPNTANSQVTAAVTGIASPAPLTGTTPAISTAATAASATGLSKTTSGLSKTTQSDHIDSPAEGPHPGTAVVATNVVQTPAHGIAPQAQSEAVLAQNALAEDGNAMEKAVSQQISRALVHHGPSGDRTMVLRLTPPELGTVRIEVIERQGVLTARLHAEDDGVRLALERFLPSMRQELRASDAPIRELTMADQSQFQRSFTDGQSRNSDPQSGQTPNRHRDDEPRFSVDGVRSAPVPPRRTQLSSRIDGSSVDALA